MDDGKIKKVMEEIGMIIQELRRRHLSFGLKSFLQSLHQKIYLQVLRDRLRLRQLEKENAVYKQIIKICRDMPEATTAALNLASERIADLKDDNNELQDIVEQLANANDFLQAKLQTEIDEEDVEGEEPN